jgi:low affinity Fe/Cu permease
MSDHDNHEAPSYDDINTTAILLAGVISAIVTLLTIFFVQGVAYQWQNAATLDRSAKPTDMAAYQEVLKQKSLLAGDEANGVLDIKTATEKAIAKFGK